MKNFKRKPIKRALLSICLTATLLAILPSKIWAAHFGDPLTSPDNTIEVTSSNFNGWSQDGYLDWTLDNTNPGVKGAFANLTGNATDGFWHHYAVYPNIPTYSDNNYFELVYDGPEIQGKLVTDWHGFEYRNYQLSPLASRHALFLFQFDLDGDLTGTTADVETVRFQPQFLASFANPQNEWNTYGIVGQDTQFIDAVNTGGALTDNRYQSIADLTLPNGSKNGSSGTGVVLPTTAVFKSVIVAGGFQGFPEIEEYIDYAQFTFDTDLGAGETLETTRFDFGQVVEPEPVVPEPSTFVLTLLGMVGLARRHRRKNT